MIEILLTGDDKIIQVHQLTLTEHGHLLVLIEGYLRQHDGEMITIEISHKKPMVSKCVK